MYNNFIRLVNELSMEWEREESWKNYYQPPKD